MNIDRLNKTIEILREVERAKKPFDMSGWIENYSLTESNEFNPCGTTCCAFGYAALDPEMQKEGLSFGMFDNGVNLYVHESPVKSIAEFNDIVKKLGTEVSGEVQFKEFTGFDAAQMFYDISGFEADFLFDPAEYDDEPVTPSHVISRIQKVIDMGGIVREWCEYR